MNNYKLVYEAHLSVNPYAILLIIVAIIAVALLIAFWKKMTWSMRIFFAVVCVILGICVCSLIASGFSSAELMEKYNNGEYETVEGVITGYETNGYLGDGVRSLDIDEFYVSEEYFCIAESNPFGFGYNVRKEHGGILDNGVNVRIAYVKYGTMNIMMQLEVAE